MTVFFFTSTGNSLAIAKRIGGNLVAIPQVINSPETHYSDDTIGIVFPVYRLAPPRMVRQFLDKVTFEADYTFAIGTYGRLGGACMYNLQSGKKKTGHRFDYANSICMVDDYLPSFDIEEEVARIPKKGIEQTAGRIVDDIHNQRHLQARSSLPMRALTALLHVKTSTDKDAQSYIVNSKCIRCGICAKVCPARNIIVKDKVFFSTHCEGCLACVHHCPRNALHLNNEKSDKRWINPEVTLAEIIKANNVV